MKQLTTILAILSLSGIAFARNEPKDLPIFTDSQVVSFVEVIREQQYSGAIRLVIKYNGVSDLETLPVTVSIFYWEETRSMQLLMTKVDGHYEVKISNGCLVGEFAGCAVYGTQEMRHLLFWAAADGLQLNALNFEVSIADVSYGFNFPQQNTL